jgi:hypothetical protein
MKQARAGIVIGLVIGLAIAIATQSRRITRKQPAASDPRTAIVRVVAQCEEARKALGEDFERAAADLPAILATEPARAASLLKQAIAPLFESRRRTCDQALDDVRAYLAGAGTKHDERLAIVERRVSDHVTTLAQAEEARAALLARLTAAPPPPLDELAALHGALAAVVRWREDPGPRTSGDPMSPP